ncbi:MAG: helix-turn-helix domain-containing protein [Blastocatellia bacterium]
MSKDKFIQIKKAAKLLGVSGKTVTRWVDAGKIEALRGPSKRRRIPTSEINRILGKVDNVITPKCFIYIRVRSKKDIQNGFAQQQKQSLLLIANKNNYEVIDSIIEVGSAFKENRLHLMKMLAKAAQKEFDVLLINNKNSVLPFGFDYLEEIFSYLGVKIVIANTEPSSIAIKETLRDTLLMVINLFRDLFLIERNANSLSIFKKLYQITKEVRKL